MKPTTTPIISLLLALFLLLTPAFTHPMPANVPIQGRDLPSRFAPIARPVFPRAYFENLSHKQQTPTRSLKDSPSKSQPLEKRGYPAGPTASALVFADKQFVPKPRVVVKAAAAKN